VPLYAQPLPAGVCLQLQPAAPHAADAFPRPDLASAAIESLFQPLRYHPRTSRALKQDLTRPCPGIHKRRPSFTEAHQGLRLLQSPNATGSC
jgi:hypothetical protein